MRLAALFGCVAAVVKTVDGLHQPVSRDTEVAQNGTPVDIPLEVFQIQAPLRDSYDGAACSRTIVQKDFTNSYGSPYVGIYTPPADCNYTTVVFNMTVTSAGINYDRLTLLYLGDNEVWRSTTAMPVRTGIFSTFYKDMTAYIPLLRQEQKVIMELGNLYNSVFTGNFNVTITALYYNDAITVNPADAVLPISSKSSAQNTTSVFSLPDGNASVQLTFPRNVERAVVSIFASGNGNEEFWYADAPAELLGTFGNRTFANGFGPWREVQLLIDGELAGFVWPKPIVFTGGINTGLWVPIVGINTFDLGSVDVDVSPWLGLLCNGSPHTFEIKAVGYNSSSESSLGTVASNWYVSGQVFLWLDKDGNQTSGAAMQTLGGTPGFELHYETTKSSDGTNSSLYLELKVRQNLTHMNTITTSKGERLLSWHQEHGYANGQNISVGGRNQTFAVDFYYKTTSSPASSTANQQGVNFDGHDIMSIFQAYIPPSVDKVVNSTLYGVIDHGEDSGGQRVLDNLVYPAENDWADTSPDYTTRQNGSCLYFWNNTYYENAGPIDPANGSVGATEQLFDHQGYISSAIGRSIANYTRRALAEDGYEPRLVVDEVGTGRLNISRPDILRGDGINTVPFDSWDAWFPS